MFRIVIALLVVAGFLGFLGYKELKLSMLAKDQPQEITCADLEAKGYGDNAHVKISNALVLDLAYVYEENTKTKAWNKVWVPLVPRDNAYGQTIINWEGAWDEAPMPEQIHVILKSDSIKNESSMEHFARSTEVQGLVINAIEQLGKEELAILTQSYPGVDFSKCLIVELNRKPASGKAYGMLGGAAVAGLAGIGLGAMMFKK